MENISNQKNAELKLEMKVPTIEMLQQAAEIFGNENMACIPSDFAVACGAWCNNAIYGKNVHCSSWIQGGWHGGVSRMLSEYGNEKYVGRGWHGPALSPALRCTPEVLAHAVKIKNNIYRFGAYIQTSLPVDTRNPHQRECHKEEKNALDKHTYMIDEYVVEGSCPRASYEPITLEEKNYDGKNIVTIKPKNANYNSRFPSNGEAVKNGQSYDFLRETIKWALVRDKDNNQWFIPSKGLIAGFQKRDVDVFLESLSREIAPREGEPGYEVNTKDIVCVWYLFGKICSIRGMKNAVKCISRKICALFNSPKGHTKAND